MPMLRSRRGPRRCWRKDGGRVPDQALVQKGGGVPIEGRVRIDLSQDLQQGLGRERPIAGRVGFRRSDPCRSAGLTARGRSSPVMPPGQGNEDTGGGTAGNVDRRRAASQRRRGHVLKVPALIEVRHRDRQHRLGMVGPTWRKRLGDGVGSRLQLDLCVTSRVRCQRGDQSAARHPPHFEHGTRQGQSGSGQRSAGPRLPEDLKGVGFPCRRGGPPGEVVRAPGVVLA